ncbi:hypothetical protein EXW32_04845 [Bacillus mycoides]|uniref:hypothetical protein n=1 Tax=Bacillus mycoides TaxID=1405 RepID=UPI001C01C769|nr:hypothetical protein [Bacillus mycoides]QWG65807.1 hypothetical protein EXW32_04845 [Bacillus mycoides]
MIVLQTYEAKITKIKIPDYIPVLGDYDISVKGEIIIGRYGYKFHAGEESGFSATSPNGYGGDFHLSLRRKRDNRMRKFSKIVICVGALIMIILGMNVHDTWKDRIYFSLAVLFVTVLSLLCNIVAHNIMDKF